MCQVQTSSLQDPVLDPADLDLEPGLDEPELCLRSQVRDPACALLDSGATHVLLPGHMLPKGAQSFEVTVNLAVGKEKARCWRDEVYAEDRAHSLLPLSRLANLLDTKFIWENGEALLQCRDKGHWRTMTKFEIRRSTMGPTGTASDSLRLEVLGESSARSKDDNIPQSWCESEDV